MQTSVLSHAKKACTNPTLADSTSSSPADNISRPSTADPAVGLSSKESQSAPLTITCPQVMIVSMRLYLIHKEKHNPHQQNCVECALSHTATQTTVIGSSVHVDNGRVKIV